MRCSVSCRSRKQGEGAGFALESQQDRLPPNRFNRERDGAAKRLQDVTHVDGHTSAQSQGRRSLGPVRTAISAEDPRLVPGVGPSRGGRGRRRPRCVRKLTLKMADFQYDQSRSFRAWLKTITQHAVSDLIASRARAVRINSMPVLESIEARADLDRRIEEIFDRELLELAIAKVRGRVASATWDAFRLMTFEGCSGAETSELLGIPVASVFVAKHRVQKLLKEEIDKMDAEDED